MGKLTDIFLRNVKPQNTDKKYFDGEGLYLLVKNNGSRLWRIKFRYNGKEKTLALGAYPDVSLAQARTSLREAKNELAKGIDPAEVKQEQIRAEQVKDENQFKKIALEWYNKSQNDWTEKHRKTIIQRLEKNIFPFFVERDINSITAKELLEALRRIEARGAGETAHRVRGICEQIYKYAISTGQTEKNIAFNLRGTLQKTQEKHLAYITDPKELGELLHRIEENTSNGIIIKTALQIMPYVFVRANELCRAEWQEIDFDKSLWTIPAERMKMRRKHTVPLSRQVISLLNELYFHTGNGKYVFHSPRGASRPITEEGLLAGLRSLGYEKGTMTIHGFRHTASTLLHELKYNSDYIEKQLAHEENKTVKATYNHAEYLEERIKLMQEWADYLDSLKNGGNNEKSYTV